MRIPQDILDAQNYNEDTGKYIKDINKSEIENIYHQLYNIRAGLTLRNPIVQVFMSIFKPGCVAAIPLDMDLPYSEWGTTVSIDSTDAILRDTAEEVSKINKQVK